MTDLHTQERFENTLARIDQANQQDPNLESVDGVMQPKELIYGQRMSQQLAEFAPDASEVLQIAARAQHIQRWQSPRDSYPKTRAGYLQWRRELGRFHAQQAANIMAEAGYDEDTIARVKALLTKSQLKQDPEVQTLEDVICLVFIRYYLEEFAASQKSHEKLISIIQKTWAKMSPRGHEAALALPLNAPLSKLIGEALA